MHFPLHAPLLVSLHDLLNLHTKEFGPPLLCASPSMPPAKILRHLDELEFH
jgi:hypothetical protein